MTYVPTFLTTLSSAGSNALQSQAKDVIDEFSSGHSGDIARHSFESMMKSANIPVGSEWGKVGTIAPAAGTPTDDAAQLEKFSAFNLAYDETIGLSAEGYVKRAGGYLSEDQGVAAEAAGAEFKTLFEQTMQQQGFNVGSDYTLTTDTEGTLLIKGTKDDAKINAYLKDKTDIEQSYARVMASFDMQQMGRESTITNDAQARAYMTGNRALMAHVLNQIINANYKSYSLSVHHGHITPLFDGKTSEERLTMLKDMFKHIG